MTGSAADAGVPLLLAAALLAWPVRPGRGRLPRREREPGWRRRVPAALAAAAVAAAAGLAVGPVLVAALAAAGAAAAVRAREQSRRERREEERVAALTEGLGALAAELRSGRPLGEAAVVAGAACGDPAGADALVRAVRAPAAVAPPSPGAGAWEVAVARLAAAVQLSVRTGCSLAAVAGAVEDDLRARHRHRLELDSALAGPRASAALLAGLPVLALLMGSGVGADPWAVLTTTATGQVLLVLGVALEAAGLAWTGRLVRRAAR